MKNQKFPILNRKMRYLILFLLLSFTFKVYSIDYEGHYMAHAVEVLKVF